MKKQSTAAMHLRHAKAYAAIRRLGGAAPIDYLLRLPVPERMMITDDVSFIVFEQRVYVCALDPALGRTVYVTADKRNCTDEFGDGFDHRRGNTATVSAGTTILFENTKLPRRAVYYLASHRNDDHLPGLPLKTMSLRSNADDFDVLLPSARKDLRELATLHAPLFAVHDKDNWCALEPTRGCIQMSHVCMNGCIMCFSIACAIVVVAVLSSARANELCEQLLASVRHAVGLAPKRKKKKRKDAHEVVGPRLKAAKDADATNALVVPDLPLRSTAKELDELTYDSATVDTLSAFDPSSERSDNDDVRVLVLCKALDDADTERARLVEYYNAEMRNLTEVVDREVIRGSRILQLVHHYFETSNLRHDSHLINLCDHRSGYAPIAKILEFKQLALLGTTVEDVVRFARGSPIVETDHDDAKIRSRYWYLVFGS